MKNITEILAILIIAGLVFLTACDKDEDNGDTMPTIVLEELGHHNSKEAHVGGDLHIGADIEAPEGIDVVQIKIHYHNGHHHIYSSRHDHEWEVDTTYTKFSGLKNTHFHEHLHIPSDAKTGKYHFHMTVTDKDGQQESVDEHLTLKEQHDSTTP